MLLHACCGPCSLEPVRILREQGVTPHIYYANSNIYPPQEYAKRRDTIADWADAEGIELVEGEYQPALWKESAGAVAQDADATMEDRCRACYRQRFEQSAAYAKANGYTHLGSTLSVSPYQFTDIIREELERACEMYGLQCAFEDYSPNYPEATRRSRDMGMYRQNYCGCAYSKAEAEQEREERKRAREQERERKALARQSEEDAIRERKAERARYDEKRAKQRAILKSLRGERAGDQEQM